MAQFARPDADTVIGEFTDEAAGTTSIFQSIDEVTPEDVGFIQSAAHNAAFGAAVYACRLSDVTDPVSSSGHILRWRTAVDVAAQEPVDFDLELRQGYVSEVTQGTLINTATTTQNRANITSTTFTDTTGTLGGAEADAITDYTDLFYRMILTWT